MLKYAITKQIVFNLACKAIHGNFNSNCKMLVNWNDVIHEFQLTNCKVEINRTFYRVSFICNGVHYIRRIYTGD
jgi:hypothetical protein